MITISKSLIYEGVYFIFRENGDEIKVNTKRIPFDASLRLTQAETDALTDMIRAEVDLSKNQKLY